MPKPRPPPHSDESPPQSSPHPVPVRRLSDDTLDTFIPPSFDKTYTPKPIDAFIPPQPDLPPRPPQPGEPYDVELGLSGALTSGGTQSSTSSTAADTPKKKKKKAAKMVAAMLKVHMSSERTFFKYLWTGLNLGGLGTFIFITFSSSSGPYLIATVVFSWVIAFAMMAFGLWGYVRRRAALDNDDPAEVPPVMAYAPFIVCVAVACVVAAGFTYALVGGGDVRGGGAGGGGFITG